MKKLLLLGEWDQSGMQHQPMPIGHNLGRGAV